MVTVLKIFFESVHWDSQSRRHRESHPRLNPPAFFLGLSTYGHKCTGIGGLALVKNRFDLITK